MVELAYNLDDLMLKVDDNVVGSDYAKRRSIRVRQRGIVMRERAAFLGGHLEVVFSPGNETCIMAKIPANLSR